MSRINKVAKESQSKSRLGDVLAVSLVAAVVNVVLAWTLSVYGQKDIQSVLDNLAATLAVFLLGGVILWFLFVFVAGRLGRLIPDWTWPFSIYILFLLGVFSPFGSPMARQGAPIVSQLLGLTLAGAILTGFLLVRAKFGAERDPWVLSAKTRTIIPVVALLTLVAAWILATRVEVMDDVSGLPSLAALATVAVLGICLVVAVLTVRWANCRRWSLSFLVVLTAAILIGPLGLRLLDGLRSRGSEILAVDSEDRPRHIVLITVDTLRADEVVGPPENRARTPHIDALKEQSPLYSNARTTSPWTRPAIASLITGLSPSVHGTTKRSSRLPDEVRTLAEFFGEAGFETAAIGRNGAIGGDLNFDQGFNEYRIYSTSSDLGTPSAGMQAVRILGISQEDPSTMDLAIRASHWIEQHADTAFFLWVHFLDPHGPYAPPPEFSPEAGEAPGRFRHGFSGVDSVRGGYMVLSEEEKQWVRKLYRGEVSYVDAGIGVILDTMHRLDLFENAVLVLTSDHGEEFFEHRLMGHGHSLYDEVLRVPLIIKAPIQGESRVVTEDVSLESVAPTLLQLSGVDPGSYPFQGSPFEPPGGERDSRIARSPIVSTGMLYFEERLGLVLARRKYISAALDRHKLAGAEVFDLISDPGETRSIAEESADDIQRVLQILERHEEESGVVKQFLGLVEGDDDPLSPELERELKAHGYIQ